MLYSPAFIGSDTAVNIGPSGEKSWMFYNIESCVALVSFISALRQLQTFLSVYLLLV